MDAGGIELSELVRALSFRTVYWTSAVIAVSVLSAIVLPLKDLGKQIVFWTLTATIIATTAFLATATIFLNKKSLTGGPIHWHADYQIWRCGEQIELVHSQGFSNKVGTPVIHGHNDKRIHIEGVITDRAQATLGHFFASVGGNLTKSSLVLQTDNGLVSLTNNQGCPNGSGKDELQVFHFSIDRSSSVARIVQKKLTNPESYAIAPESQVPDGDCLIFEFGSSKDRTTYLCQSYQTALTKGEITNGY